MFQQILCSGNERNENNNKYERCVSGVRSYLLLNEASTNKVSTNEASTNEASTNEATINETSTNEASTNETSTNIWK